MMEHCQRFQLDMEIDKQILRSIKITVRKRVRKSKLPDA